MATLTTVPDPAPRSAKAEATRAGIIDAAMALFRSEGYDKTTMRAIARDAGVSVGNAYYYFASKEHLIQAFYDDVQTRHAAAASEVLDTERAFAARLRGVLDAWLEVAEPSHEFAAQFFRTAADPASPMSPFSDESAPAREASIALYERLVAGSDLKVPAGLRAELPELLWLMQMGVVLFWVHDRSDGQARSHALVRQVVPVMDRLLRLTRVPGVRGFTDDVVTLVRSLRD